MRIIIPKYKSWLATAALVAVLTSVFANGPLAAPMTKPEPEVIQQQTPAPGTLSIIAILIGLVERQVAIDGTSNTILFGAPARVQAIRYTNPVTGHTVISVLDPAIPHKWPEWNFMGAIWDFFEQAPTR
jgi:hypothetical protein